MGVEAVGHQLELAVRGDEGDGAIILEPREANALVEFDVLHFDGFPPRGAAGGLEHGFVVEAEAELGHAGEVALHFHSAENL